MNKLAAAVFSLGVLGCVIAGVVIGLDAPESEFDSLARDVSETTNYQLLVDAALSDFDANNARAEGAPQQQVVNGWVARDLLQIVTRQNEAQADTLDSIVALQAADPPDDRGARLLMILIVLIGWVALWATLPTMLGRSTATVANPPHRPRDEPVVVDPVLDTEAERDDPLTAPPANPAAAPEPGTAGPPPSSTWPN